ncbi:MAG: hypothetical protein LBT39_10075 [Treponema sp.]|jgi:hypothetical protein|nr:hypothetical protein [Treponema sp.]
MNRNLGAYVTHIAVALYLLVDGILGLTEKTVWQRIRLATGTRNATGNEIVDTLAQVFGNSDLTKTLIVVFSVLAIAGGAFLLLELFQIKIPVADVIILVFLIVWLVFIILSDVVYPFRSDNRNFAFLPWLRILASHLVVLGALITASHRFGS